MEHITRSIQSRRSVRTFDGRQISPAEIQNLMAFMATIENPYKLPVEFALLDAKQNGLSCPVVSGTELYVAGKIKQLPQASVAFGYAFEVLLLYAQSLGIGSVWLGGTMNRPAYEKAMHLAADEMMPCAAALGYPAKKMSLKETVMRKAVQADVRLDFESLFFKEDFYTPLKKEDAQALAHPLEMVRLAPSAVNKQPWRAVVTGDTVHFYLKRSKGFSAAAIDMQKVDMGIALCHFDLAAKEVGLKATFVVSPPAVETGSDVEYIASYRIKE